MIAGQKTTTFPIARSHYFRARLNIVLKVREVEEMSMTMPVSDDERDFTAEESVRGAQVFLLEADRPPSVLASMLALLACALLLGVIVKYTGPQQSFVDEKPLELVLEAPLSDAAPAAPQTPPDIQDSNIPSAAVEEASPPQVTEPPPPPATEPEPVVHEPAAAEPPKPVTPIEKKAEPKPQQKKKTAARPPSPARQTNPEAEGVRSSNTMVSNYPALVFARINRAAASNYPRTSEGARITYRIVVGPSGQVLSKSVGSAGNSALTAAASAALDRAAPFPPSGTNRPVAIAGAIVYRPR